jgi:alpha-galactosidase
VDVYRIDFNIAPQPFWRETDAPDRQGITENKYAMGFLEYLDQLQKLHPTVLIDTCASGGRRDDLETLRRAVPMHRSDYSYEPVGQQNITYGMSFWIPYFGSPNGARDNYVFRSSWGPQINVVWDLRRTDLDYDWIRRATGQWRAVADNYLGDYYPLTPYDPTDHAWMAWQFDRPGLGAGVSPVKQCLEFRAVRASWFASRRSLRNHQRGRARYADIDRARADAAGPESLAEGQNGRCRAHLQTLWSKVAPLGFAAKKSCRWRMNRDNCSAES